MSQFHNPDDEPSAPCPIRIPIDDNHKFSINEYRNELYADIRKKKKEQKRREKERKKATKKKKEKKETSEK